MNKYIKQGMSIITVSFFFLVQLEGGVSNTSYRIRGMGRGILDFTNDLYSDVFYNPAYISKIDGFHLFTNLSNLSTLPKSSFNGNGLPFLMNNLYPSNMVGFMGRWRFLSGGAFVLSEGFSLELITDENGIDRSSGSSSYYEDEYVHKNNSTSRVDFGGRQIIGLGTINLFGLRLGVMGTYKDFSIGFGSRSEYSNSLTQNGTVVETEEDTYDITIAGKTKTLGLTVGTLIVSQSNTELSISGGLRPRIMDFSSSWISDWLDEPYYYASSGSFHSAASNFRLTDDESVQSVRLAGSELFANARLIKTLSESTRLSTFGEFSSLLFPITITDEYSYKSERKRPSEWLGSEIIQFGTHYLNEETGKSNGEGLLAFLSIKGGIGFEHTFEDGTLFIAGIKGTYAILTSKIEMDPRTFEEVYINISEDPNTPVDYQYGYERSTTYHDQTILKGSGQLLFLEVPSALEFNLFNNLQVRFGTNQFIPVYGSGKIEINNKEGATNIETRYTHGPDANTTETEIIEDALDEHTSTFKISSTHMSLSSYHAGLGYTVNENVVIDILRFSNLTDLSSWLFSIQISL